MDELKKLRERIDWLDTQIASLLNERMRAVDQIGKVKRVQHQEVTDTSREQNVLTQVEMIIQHPTLKSNIAHIYQEIMHESKITQQFFQHPTQPFRRIGIIGLGLIGGSICKGIKMKDSSIEIGSLKYESDDYSLALEGGWVDHVYSSMKELIQNSELLILATPLSTMIGFAEEIKLHSDPLKKLIVIDVASVKGTIIEAFEKLSSDQIEYIGTHPMAGKEKGGFANSHATLFVSWPWIVVPHKKNSPEAIDSISQFIHFLGAELISLDAETHDKQTALVSHLPSLLAKSYFDFVNSIDQPSIKIAGPGFKSFTRLAHDNPEMRSEIIEYNKQVIRSYLEQWLEGLK